MVRATFSPKVAPICSSIGPESCSYEMRMGPLRLVHSGIKSGHFPCMLYLSADTEDKLIEDGAVSISVYVRVLPGTIEAVWPIMLHCLRQ